MVSIDTTFDFRSDTPAGGDSDSRSPSLLRYQQLLWSKPLPRGDVFDLDAITPGYYLLHRSALGQFELGSDAVMASYTGHITMAPILAHFSEEEQAAFDTLGYTIGAMLVFPSNRVDGKMTINGARGFLPKISDRMDLTLECIRRHYRGETSPLDATLARYADPDFSKVLPNDDFSYWTVTVERPVLDESAKPVVDRKGTPKPDAKNRYTDNVPFTYGGSTAGAVAQREVIQTYFDAEVKPHVADAWIDWTKTKTGYEIPFTRHFYKTSHPGRSPRSTPIWRSKSPRSSICCGRWSRSTTTVAPRSWTTTRLGWLFQPVSDRSHENAVS